MRDRRLAITFTVVVTAKEEPKQSQRPAAEKLDQRGVF